MGFVEVGSGEGDKEALPPLIEKMTPEQIKEAERLASEFKSRHSQNPQP